MEFGLYCAGLRGEWFRIPTEPFCFIVTFRIQFNYRLLTFFVGRLGLVRLGSALVFSVTTVTV